VSARRYTVGSSATVRATTARVYAVIADYRDQHPHIVPSEYFRSLTVLEGGVGAGTRTRVEMRVLGTTRIFEQVVTEPAPGRVLVETNLDGSGVTTFTVDAAEGGQAARVTIATEIEARPGLAGAIERFFTSLLLPRIYRRELEKLAEHVGPR
jgi:polyketide cyclase/dehydrase/lipid transport protein